METIHCTSDKPDVCLLKPNTIDNSTKRLWPNGKIYYRISIFETEALLEKVKLALAGWNSILAPNCEFIECDSTSQQHHVTFEQCPPGNPTSTVGYQPGTNQYIRLPERYENGKPSSIECILHEMLHCIGFHHESLQELKKPYCLVENQELAMSVADDTLSIAMGKDDFYSLMRYGPGVAKAKDYETPVFSPHALSAGDRAKIRLVYGGKGTHHGDWHHPCESEACTVDICECGSCGRLPGGIRGGVNCGYVGVKAHWTCCLSEDKGSTCKTTHAGFWHAKCVGKKCSKDGCCCYNCGGGCSYEGSAGHWNCCQQDDFHSVCSKINKATLHNTL
jgi:hypothetical protein